MSVALGRNVETGTTQIPSSVNQTCLVDAKVTILRSRGQDGISNYSVIIQMQVFLLFLIILILMNKSKGE